jgi:oxamate amidohydrolase
MLQTHRSYRGMVTAPHHLAARAGLGVLEDGGDAIEAMVAAAAAIAVVYPHMNGLGGDNFWLIHTPGEPVIGIDACGAAAGLSDTAYYTERGLNGIPSRGPDAALTMAGAVSGWREALKVGRKNRGEGLPLSRLFEDAIHYARDGVSVTQTQAGNTLGKLDELRDAPGFVDTFLIDEAPPVEGARFRQARLADTLDQLAKAGLDDFYRGDLARSMSGDLERAGSPLRFADFERHAARRTRALSLDVAGHRVFNMPPPTQGLASLMLLGIYDRLNVQEAEGFAYIHALVEATKGAFRVRDRFIGDPDYMTVRPEDYLTDSVLDEIAAGIDLKHAAPWPTPSAPGDTVWLGAIDREGRAVSFIQSVYWEFGSGVVLNESGVTWQNRGVSFSLDESHHNVLKPHRRPFHTIQPALAHLSDGRVMAYGTMGGEGQPQTQAMVFSRYAMHGQSLQRAVSAPRWLLGRTWGSETSNLRIENRIDPDVIQALAAAGHDIETVGEYDESMGHAGAVVMRPDGLIEGASDPRSDGAVATF